MRKLALILSFIILTACNTVKVPLEGDVYNPVKVKVHSDISEKHSLNISVFQQNGGVRGFNFKSAYVSFKSPTLKNAGFGIGLSKADAFSYETEPAGANTFVLIDSVVTPEYRAKVWKMTSAHPAFAKYETEFKSIFVSVKRNGLYITAGNDSDFKDNITPQFIFEKLSQLHFELKPKK